MEETQQSFKAQFDIHVKQINVNASYWTPSVGLEDESKAIDLNADSTEVSFQLDKTSVQRLFQDQGGISASHRSFCINRPLRRMINQPLSQFHLNLHSTLQRNQSVFLEKYVRLNIDFPFLEAAPPNRYWSPRALFTVLCLSDLAANSTAPSQLQEVKLPLFKLKPFNASTNEPLSTPMGTVEYFSEDVGGSNPLARASLDSNFDITHSVSIDSSFVVGIEPSASPSLSDEVTRRKDQPIPSSPHRSSQLASESLEALESTNLAEREVEGESALTVETLKRRNEEQVTSIDGLSIQVNQYRRRSAGSNISSSDLDEVRSICSGSVRTDDTFYSHFVSSNELSSESQYLYNALSLLSSAVSSSSSANHNETDEASLPEWSQYWEVIGDAFVQLEVQAIIGEGHIHHHHHHHHHHGRQSRHSHSSNSLTSISTASSLTNSPATNQHVSNVLSLLRKSKPSRSSKSPSSGSSSTLPSPTLSSTSSFSSSTSSSGKYSTKASLNLSQMKLQVPVIAEGDESQCTPVSPEKPLSIKFAAPPLPGYHRNSSSSPGKGNSSPPSSAASTISAPHPKSPLIQASALEDSTTIQEAQEVLKLPLSSQSTETLSSSSSSRTTRLPLKITAETISMPSNEPPPALQSIYSQPSRPVESEIITQVYSPLLCKSPPTSPPNVPPGLDDESAEVPSSYKLSFPHNQEVSDDEDESNQSETPEEEKLLKMNKQARKKQGRHKASNKKTLQNQHQEDNDYLRDSYQHGGGGELARSSQQQQREQSVERREVQSRVEEDRGRGGGERFGSSTPTSAALSNTNGASLLSCIPCCNCM